MDVKSYLSNWNFSRILRLAMAVFIIIQGFQTHEWMFVILGALFALMPIFNIGCAGGTCAVPPPSKSNRRNSHHQIEETQYEEVK